MKVLVIGNCQARPLGNLIAKYTDHDVLEPIILHLSKEAEAQEHQERIAQADLVVLSRFSSGLFRAMFAMKETRNGNEIH